MTRAMRRSVMLVSGFGLLCAAGCNQADPLCGFVPHEPGEMQQCEPAHHAVRVSYSAVTVAPDRLVLAQNDDGDRAWEAYPLAADGFPAGDPTEMPAIDDGAVAVWPGPARTALVTVSGANLAVMLSDDAGLRTLTTEAPRTRVAAAFDGRAYWMIAETPGVTAPVVQRRITPDGVVSSEAPTLALDPLRSHTNVQLASASAGELVATWVEHAGLPSAPPVVKAQRLLDGVADGDAWTVAEGTGVECLWDDHKLLVLADGYHVLARRGPCDGAEAHMVDLHLDLGGRVAAERAGTSPVPELPRDWAVGPMGILAWDERTAWLVDASRGAVEVAWTASPDETLRAVVAATPQFVLVIETDDPVAPHVDLAQLVGPAERVVVAQDRWRDDASGCSTGRSPSLLVGVLGALWGVARRRR